MRKFFSASKKTLVLLGPTASGKTRLAVGLASQFNGEIISADSRQVYRGLNLGAGKDLNEYQTAHAVIPHHLIDEAGLDEEFNVFRFQRRFWECLEEIVRRGALPMLVGGTGMYLEAALQGYDLTEVPENPALRGELEPLTDAELRARLVAYRGRVHNTTDFTTRERLLRAVEIAAFAHGREKIPRPPLDALVLGMRINRERLRERIGVRLRQRLRDGLVEEIQGLHDQGVSWERLERLGLEYRFGSLYLQGRLGDSGELFRRLHLAICDFAKRQETWFRRMERRGTAIAWLEEGEEEQRAAGRIREWLERPYAPGEIGSPNNNERFS